MEPHFLTPFGAGVLVDIRDNRAGFGDDATGRDRLHCIHLGKAEDNTAREWHRLTVIAGAGAARGDRDAEFVAGPQDMDDLVLVLRRDDDVTGDMVKLSFKHRGVPEEIPALLLD